MDVVCEEVKEAREKEHVDAQEPHCAQPQVEANFVIPATKLAHEGLVNQTTALADEILVNWAIKLANKDLVNPAIELVDEDMVKLTTELAEDNETVIGVVYVKVNPTKNIVDVNFDEELLANDEWLQVMHQKHHINVILFCETVEDNMFVVAQVSIETYEEEKKEAQKRKHRQM